MSDTIHHKAAEVSSGIDALIAQRAALLERVTVLKKALATVDDINDDDWFSREARKDEHPRDEIRRLIVEAMDA